MSTMPRLCLLMTGSELMSGDTLDTNSCFLSSFFDELGIETLEKVTVGDDLEILSKQIQRLSKEYDIVFTNGGLGPTQDDLTAEAFALAAGTKLAVNKQAEEHIAQWCELRGFKASPSNLKQSILPADAEIFPNAPGSAPAFFIRLNNAMVLATPGVPKELKTIVQLHIPAFINKFFAINNIQQWQKYQLFGIGESSLQEKLNASLPETISQNVDIGFRVNFPYVELKLKAKHNSGLSHIENIIKLLSSNIIGPANTTMAEIVVKSLHQSKLSIATAESCTGGLIASEITKTPGASVVFPGGVVSYSNEIKAKTLGVPCSTLDTHGAVSKETVIAMHAGCCKTFETDMAIAVSGIAGPDGGSREKPNGTVWIAWGKKGQIKTECFFIPLERQSFQQIVAALALDLTRREILGIECGLDYLGRWKR